MITRLSPDIANFVCLQELDVSHNGNPLSVSSLFEPDYINFKKKIVTIVIFCYFNENPTYLLMLMNKLEQSSGVIFTSVFFSFCRTFFTVGNLF